MNFVFANVDAGATAWVLAASALVMLMTPGLAFFYGGMVRAKHMISILMQNFTVLALVSVVWVVASFSLAFEAGNGFVGDLHFAGLANMTQNIPGYSGSHSNPRSSVTLLAWASCTQASSFSSPPRSTSISTKEETRTQAVSRSGHRSRSSFSVTRSSSDSVSGWDGTSAVTSRFFGATGLAAAGEALARIWMGNRRAVRSLTGKPRSRISRWRWLVLVQPSAPRRAKYSAWSPSELARRDGRSTISSSAVVARMNFRTVSGLRRSAIGLQRDWNAVMAGLTLSWSSGPVEGHVNRVTMLKRQMLGRAKPDLLRKRVLLS